MLGIAEQCRSPTILQKLRDLVSMKGGVERHGDPAGTYSPQVGRHPPRMVGRQNGHAGIAVDPAGKPVSHRFGHLLKFGESDTLYSVLALNLEGRVVGEFSCGFLKPLVEVGHGSE